MLVKIERDGNVMTIILNRPQARNAVNGPAAKALARAFRKFEEDDKSYVAVLFGAGGNFCAGADLKAIFAARDQNRVSPLGDGPMGPSRMVFKKPVIAAVSGYAVAGGLELALMCDLRVVERSATLAIFSRRYGVPLIDGGTVRLPRLIGLSRALDLILTGRPIDAEEALIMGLANRLSDDDMSREVAEGIAQDLARFPQTCLRHDRLSAYQQFDLSFNAAIKNEFRHGLKSLKSKEFLQGIQPFIQGKGRHGKF